MHDDTGNLAISDNKSETTSEKSPTASGSVWRILGIAVGWTLLALTASAMLGGMAGVVFGVVGGPTAIKSPVANQLFSTIGAIGFLGTYLVAGLVQARIAENGNTSLGLANNPMMRLILVTLLAIFVIAWGCLLNFAAYRARPDLAFSVYSSNSLLYAVSIVTIVFLAPFAEELFVRGWLWTALWKHWNVLLTASFTSVGWLALHLDRGIGFLVILLPVAAALSAARYFAGSVRASIIVHMAYNFTGIVMPWIMKHYGVI